MFEITNHTKEQHDIIVKVFAFSFGEKCIQGTLETSYTTIIEADDNLRGKRDKLKNEVNKEKLREKRKLKKNLHSSIEIPQKNQFFNQ